MRLILKILVAPIIVVLTLFVWICSGLLYCSSFILGLAGTVLGILAVLVLLTGAVTNGIIVLVMAFLVSPFGIPMAAAWLIGKIQDLRYAIQDRVYG
ncbi:CD1845 family protein [Caproiciproducens galactitolivorans]|uniref:CD1845 family protein n=1 Tax=Caproiciproducens galactitolivorans TaxID=642589 RepID=UPI0024095252|nr:CD1845 family protein [Caproiciproducens galactitolivorans]